MDLTQASYKEKNARAKKMMLWFAIISLSMGFAGWTSAYIVSSSREDWLADFELPTAFFISTLLIIISSGTYWMAKKAIQSGTNTATLWLVVTLLLGFAFIGMQFQGFSQLIGEGYYFTGPTSNITMSYIYLIAAVHILHVVAGLISLLVVLIQQIKGKYTANEMLGFELGATFWHFLGVLWLYLILFFYFYRA